MLFHVSVSDPAFDTADVASPPLPPSSLLSPLCRNAWRRPKPQNFLAATLTAAGAVEAGVEVAVKVEGGSAAGVGAVEINLRQ